MKTCITKPIYTLSRHGLSGPPHLRLLRMLLEPPGKSEMFFGRGFSRYRTAFTFRNAESNRVEQPFPSYTVECYCKFDK